MIEVYEVGEGKPYLTIQEALDAVMASWTGIPLTHDIYVKVYTGEYAEDCYLEGIRGATLPGGKKVGIKIEGVGNPHLSPFGTAFTFVNCGHVGISGFSTSPNATFDNFLSFQGPQGDLEITSCELSGYINFCSLSEAPPI